jgi:hypothetical protein
MLFLELQLRALSRQLAFYRSLGLAGDGPFVTPASQPQESKSPKPAAGNGA